MRLLHCIVDTSRRQDFFPVFCQEYVMNDEGEWLITTC